MIHEEKKPVMWTEPRDYPLPSAAEGKAVKEQSPPCPNGCGNEEVRRSDRRTYERRKGITGTRRGAETRSSVTYFYCEHCMSFFQIKVEDLQRSEASVSAN